MKKRLLGGLLAVTMTVTLLVGCGQKEETTTEPEDSTEAVESEEAENAAEEEVIQEEANLTMWTFLDVNNPTNSRAVALGQLIESFEAANPGITVTVEAQDHTTLAAKYYAAFQAGNAPDIVQVDVTNLSAGIEMGAFSTLESLFYDDWSEEEKADVSSDVWEVGADENGHYQVCLFGGVYGILYRSDYFEKFGINVEDIKTYEDLYEAAEKLTFVDDNGMQVYGLGIGYATSATDANGILINTLLNQEGGIYNEDGTPNDWAGDLGQAALQMQLDAVSRGITPDTCASMDYEDVLVAFEAGEYAMVFAPTLRIPTVCDAASFDSGNIKFMEYPVWEEGMTNRTFTGGWFTCVNSESNQQQAAGKFLEYLCSEEGDEIWVTVGEQVPLRKSTLDNLADYINQPENEWLATATELHAGAYMAPTTIVTAGVNEDMQNAFLRAYVDGMSLEEALQSVEEDFVARNLNR